MTLFGLTLFCQHNPWETRKLFSTTARQGSTIWSRKHLLGMLCLGHSDCTALAIYEKLHMLEETICNASVITIKCNVDKI